MTKKRENIASLSVDEAKAAILRGESRSDFEAVGKLGDDEIERQAESDPEEGEWDWANASLELPKPKIGVHVKLDADIIAFFNFKKEGGGYQTRINAALESYVKHAAKKRA